MTNSFFRNDVFKIYLTFRNVDQLIDVHANFINRFIIDVLIKKQQLFNYSLKRNLIDHSFQILSKHVRWLKIKMIHEFQTRHQDENAWIRSIETNDFELCIVCFSNAQIEKFWKQIHFQMNMTYSKIANEMTKFVFTSWNVHIKKNWFVFQNKFSKLIFYRFSIVSCLCYRKFLSHVSSLLLQSFQCFENATKIIFKKHVWKYAMTSHTRKKIANDHNKYVRQTNSW